ncbi:MAG: sigma-70 family RNA polymerase sigma factor [Sedimentisphaerales bacterium]|nr:sigma-70 family RNA polymerase sigma factor [Sedimentisphaerales bacterium]
MRRALDDRQLVEQSIGGDTEAFGVLVNRYQSLICAVTYSATGNIERSEELAQEAFLRAWKNLPQLKDLSRFRAWLCTIARNLGSRAIEKRRRDVVDRATGLDAAEFATDGCEPCERLVGKEQQEAVWAALEAIPGAYREPMVLFYRRQQSVSQVAADLELSEHVVRQRLYRGRQLLKAEISSVVEETLSRSGPGKAFTVAVVAALPALTAQTASAAVAGAVAEGTPAAKPLLAAGLSGAVLGPILGLLGAVLGCWCSIKNTNSPRERRFMIRMTILFWLFLLLCIGLPLTLALAGLISRWVFWSCFALYFVFLLPLMFWSNARQRRIQMEEGTYRRPEDVVRHLPGQAVPGNFAGAIFGSQIWVLLVAGATGDWTAALIVFLLAFLVFFLSLRVYAGRSERYLRAGLVALLGVGAIDFGVVCLRWQTWQRVAEFEEKAGNVPFWLVALLIVVFVAVMAIAVIRADRRRSAAAAQPPGEDAASESGDSLRSGIYGSFAGAVFGSAGWLFMMSLRARDWTAAVVAVYAVVVFILSVRSCIAQPRRIWPILLLDVAALYVLHLVVLNVRWSHWMATWAQSDHPSSYAGGSLSYMNVLVTCIAAALALWLALRWTDDRRRDAIEK